MLTVGKTAPEVERALCEGRLACPGCGGELRPWSHARRRTLRTLESGIKLIERPRRAICRGCGATHVLLPANLLARRGDELTVIGAALERAARGQGYEPIAAALGRPISTVRSWICRARGRAGQIRAGLAGWIVALDPDPPPLAPALSPWEEAVVVICAVHRAARARWPIVDSVSVWEWASLWSNGTLLAPGITIRRSNTNPLC